ncbi:MAG TPA: SDR family oxidoreductase [Candidatus Heimdallarchaeota archaeon]|nr:SDR family oxidoreductase [Candidatus Heimdallarchaeota archaeon]
MTERQDLVGKGAMITGGGSGIGLGCARYLAEAGARVAIIDVNEAAGKAACEQIGSGAIFVRGDVSSSDDCRHAVEEVAERFGRIDILVNSAGVIRRKSVVDLMEEEWDLVLDVSLKGTYLMSKYVIPVMERDGGAIVNIGSGWGLKGSPQAAAYCAAKGGVVNLTRAMAIDHSPQKIRVNCVCPGDVDTPLLRSEAVQLGADEKAFMAEAADRPLARVGTPLDIAKAVYFLVSDLSPWVTGAVVVVDGGGLA